MKRYELYKIRKDYFQNNYKYKCVYWKEFDFDIFDKIMYIKRSGQGHDETYNDCIIMADTETSKERYKENCRNYVVAWSMSVLAFDTNIVTLYGHKPSEFIECVEKMCSHFQGEKTIIYWHNIVYDWVFIRKFCFRKWGTPDKQLNIKSHYPLFINFNNGIIFKDSLILAQRKLEKWAEDLDVEHKKAVGSWNYDKVRNQSDEFSADEIHYIENDTLAGVECINKMMQTLHKHIYSMPYTATGIVREAVREIGKDNHARDLFKRLVPEYYVQCILENVYHGGFTHANRHYISRTIKGDSENGFIICRDFNSSYPFSMIAFKYPMERFTPLEKNVKPSYILRNSENYAFIFKLIMLKPELKNNTIPMPALQMSKCIKSINAIEDNGRILQSEYVEIYLNEIDLKVICEQYDFKGVCIEVHFAAKDYLPRWFTDYVYECYSDKCKLKDGDPVLYNLAKARVNCLYGMLCQKPCKEMIDEDYQTGDFSINKDASMEELYDKYVKKYTSVLPYMWGVWVTSFSFANLFELGKCVAPGGVWIYSDTDSCYSNKWDDEKINAYNEHCKELLKANGYGAVKIGAKEYWLGCADVDGIYSEFRTVGAKRYCCRYADIPKYREPDEKGNIKANKLKITVAGVPKKAAKSLKDDINNFHRNFTFDGETSGKLQHTYYFESDIWIDANGNERGDSIDLSLTTYVLDDVETIDWEKLWEDEIDNIYYEEGDEE